VLLSWPLIFHLNSTLFGDFGDTRATVAWFWISANGLLDAPINHLITAPFGVETAREFSSPVFEWPVLVLSKLLNEVVAYNLFILFSFPLTALATYFLLNGLLENKIAAFIGGLIFGFCPSAVMQAAGGHAAFAFNVFIPVFLWALFYNRAQRTILSAFYVAASFSLIVLTALYFGYFAIYMGIFFIIFDLLSSRKEDRAPIIRNYIYGVIFAVFLILPFEYRAIFEQFSLGGDVLAKSGHIRDFNELTVYSSRPWDFLIPSVDHPVLGKYVYDFVRSHLHGSNIFEQSLYLGVIPVGLSLVGCILFIRGKFDAVHRTYFLFFSFGALWMYFLSLPPLISIGNFNVPTVSWFTYHIASMFRVYARFGILVIFFVACAVAVVLAHVSIKMKRAHYYALLVVLLPLLCFEYWSIPSSQALPVDKTPEVYLWLSKEPKEIMVVEYPMMKSDDASFYTYLFWQRIHKKELVNGATRDNEKAWDFFEKVNDLGNSQTPVLLKSVGVKYVIVHGDMYKDGPIPSPIKRYYPVKYASETYNDGRMPAVSFPLKLVKTFGTDLVFSLEGSENPRTNLPMQPSDSNL